MELSDPQGREAFNRLIACSDGQLLQLLAAADAHGTLDLESLAPKLAQHPVAL